MEQTGVHYRWTGKGRSRRDQCPQPVWEAIQDYLQVSGKLESIQPEDYIFTPLTDRAARLPARICLDGPTSRGPPLS